MTFQPSSPSPDDAVIVGGARTPFTRLLGAQKQLGATDLGAAAIKGALERSGVAAQDIEQVLMGQVVPSGPGSAGTFRPRPSTRSASPACWLSSTRPGWCVSVRPPWWWREAWSP
jgi:hypothetical protein